MEYLYWKLDEVSCVNIVRNKKWFNEVIKEIQEVWNIILKEKKLMDMNIECLNVEPC